MAVARDTYTIQIDNMTYEEAMELLRDLHARGHETAKYVPNTPEPWSPSWKRV